jgi:hypothetical protein
VNQFTLRLIFIEGGATEPPPQATQRTEYYRTEFSKRRDARELLVNSDHQGIPLHDGAGGMLTGIRLELKPGMAFTH